MIARELAPQPKVIAAAVAGALTVVLAWVLAEFGIVLPAPVTAAVTVLLTAGAAYLRRG